MTTNVLQLQFDAAEDPLDMRGTSDSLPANRTETSGTIMTNSVLQLYRIHGVPLPVTPRCDCSGLQVKILRCLRGTFMHPNDAHRTGYEVLE